MAGHALRRAAPALGVAVLGAATFAVLRHVDPYSPDSLLPPCPIHAMTGLFCPGCGSTRALHALAHADLATAWQMNPLLVLALPLLAMMLLRAAMPAAMPRRLLPLPGARSWLWAIVLFTVARNLPWPPFETLAPG